MQEFVEKLIIVLGILMSGFILFAFIMTIREWIEAHRESNSEKDSEKGISKNERR